jgi:primosomal protein N' (replication factor Y)
MTEIYKYPPYFRIIKLTLKQRDFNKLKEGAMWLYQVSLKSEHAGSRS